jgi:predicted outer membrane repeat protein
MEMAEGQTLREEVMNRIRIGLVSVLVAAAFLPAAEAQAVIRYVALDGSGTNGQSWATAYNSIPAALNDPAVTAGSEIWVKQGTYTTEQPIEVTKAVGLYGGFSGVGDVRNWQVYPTTIDGLDTANHCLRVTANAIIDGLAVMGGWGQGPEPLGAGAAIINCTATVSNCLFKYNWTADSGGAVATYQANGTTFTNCTFMQNTASATGGAIYNEEGTGLQIIDCVFIANATYDSGAGIHNYRCGVTITGCVFQYNGASLEEVGVGGAILNDEASPTVTGCIFEGNSAPYGAGVFNYGSTAVIDGCWFTDCDPETLSGGGVYNYGGAPTVQNCLFDNNAVREEGGALITVLSGSKTINCVFWNNTADYGGGAINVGTEPNAPVASPQFINCTIYGNTSRWQGGGVFSRDTPSSFINCIVWGNTADTGEAGIASQGALTSGNLVVRYCDVQTNSGVFPGIGNVRVDPRFGDPNESEFTLSFDSPCLDAGSNAAVLGIFTDYTGSTRIVDGNGDGVAVVDMGAFELQGVQDHLLRGQIIQSTAYDDPGDYTPTYTFLLRLETDDALTSVEFQAPASDNWYTIPGDSHTSSGSVETYHRVQGRTHVWEYWHKANDAAGLRVYGDGTYRLVAHYRNNTQAQTQIGYLVPGTTSPIPQPTQRPQVLSPAYGATLPSPVRLTWDACTDSAANAIYLTIIDANSNAEAAGDALPRSATQSGEYRLTEGTYDADVGFANLYETASTDGTRFQFGKTVLVGHRFAVPYTAVFRFWSPVSGRHFYTSGVGERDKLINNYTNVWTFEGTAFYACSAQSAENLLPVYRFWSGQSHFYTIDEAEKEKVVTQYSKVWTLEGVAFYAYPDGSELPGTRAVYRFWNRTNNTHFYTMSEAEANKLITQYAGVFAYEGVAFYAYPP